jgi:hypothetical protein
MEIISRETMRNSKGEEEEKETKTLKYQQSWKRRSRR